MYKVLVIGAVNSTRQTLGKLVEHGFDVVGVLGHEPVNRDRVSGWVDLKEISEKLKVPFKGFQRINDPKNIEWAKAKHPDIIFAVGFSQLIHSEWINMPKLGCVGFHPTALPKGRGRAPLAWITLEKSMGSASFFLISESADDGPVFVQELFPVVEEDDAESVRNKIETAIKKSLDKWLPELKQGHWNPVPQDEAEATLYGKRGPEDGHINWNDSAVYLNRLIKASSRPHPGAYTYFKDSKMMVWKCTPENEIPIKGVIRRILQIDKKRGYLVQCGEGLLWLNEIELEEDLELRVGDKLGYNIEDEIYKIKKLLKERKDA